MTTRILSCLLFSIPALLLLNQTGKHYVQSVWHIDGSDPAARLLGMQDKAHTNIDGQRYSEFVDNNRHGQVVGFSRKYWLDGNKPDDSRRGTTAWLVSDDKTEPIGLYDLEQNRLTIKV